MKKALIFLSILVFLLMAACGQEVPAEVKPAPTETTAPEMTSAPAETPEPAATPEPAPDPTPFEAPEVFTLPRLTLASGGKETEALLDTAHWTCRNGKGEAYAEKISLSETVSYRDRDWYSLDAPILYANGAVSLSFSTREPKNP